MENLQSITDKLASVIKDRKVISSVFTTFNFEPDFFELDVIPELIGRDIPYSTDERVKTFQVREALRESSLDIDIFFDKKIFMAKSDQSPQMEYLCHGVDKGNACFHAKNIFLLVVDEDNGEKSLLMASGSNNLTRAGWWRNIEVQHWEEITHKGVSEIFLNRIKDDIKKLISLSSFGVCHALTKVNDFIHSCSSSRQAKQVNYYAASEEKNLFQWLSNIKNKPLSQYKNWNLEIISPYFCEDQNDDLHKEFLKLGVQDITMLLPIGEDETALCQKGYFDHISGCEGIKWGRWRPEMLKNIGIDGDIHRKLHAKIYHFFNGIQAWIFIGSVNFTNKASGMLGPKASNIESGFFLKMPSVKEMLEPIKDPDTIDNFESSDDDYLPELDSNENDTIPEIQISYNWKNKELSANTKRYMSYEIALIGNANQQLTTPWPIQYTTSIYTKNTDKIEEEIRNSSFVTVKGKNIKTGEEFPCHKVMVQQIGWTHKPLDLPTLTPEQILAIYAGMKPDQRQSAILNAMLKRLIRLGSAGEITAFNSDESDVDFFCEYAEIFTSFRIFKGNLLNSLEDKEADVDYYLTGTGVDSLPTLLANIVDPELENFDPVNSYLILLSAQEIFKMKEFSKRPQVSGIRSGINRKIKVIKETIELKQQGKMAGEFFKWFESQFRKEYKVSEVIKETEK